MEGGQDSLDIQKRVVAAIAVDDDSGCEVGDYALGSLK